VFRMNEVEKAIAVYLQNGGTATELHKAVTRANSRRRAKRKVSELRARLRRVKARLQSEKERLAKTKERIKALREDISAIKAQIKALQS